MSIRELNANVSQALARAEGGEILSITRNGKPIVELRPARREHDEALRAAIARLDERMRQGFGPGMGTVTYEEKYGEEAL